MNHPPINNHSHQLSSTKATKQSTIQPKNCSAVILAAGKGSRLGYSHKALLKVQGKTLLAHWLSKLFDFGIEEIVVVDLKSRQESTKKQIWESAGPHSSKVLLVTEQNPVDPISAMIAGSQRTSKQNIYFLSADTLTTFPLSNLFFEPGSWGKILMKHEINKGYLYLSAQWHVSSTAPPESQEKLSFVYGGLSLMPKLNWEKETQSITPSQATLFKVIMKAIELQKVEGVLVDEKNEILHNINTPEDLERAQSLILN